RPPLLDLLPHISRDGNHRLSAEWRNAGARAANRGARVAAHDQTLRPHPGRDFARRGRADQDLITGYEESYLPGCLKNDRAEITKGNRTIFMGKPIDRRVPFNAIAERQ